MEKKGGFHRPTSLPSKWDHRRRQPFNRPPCSKGCSKPLSSPLRRRRDPCLALRESKARRPPPFNSISLHPFEPNRPMNRLILLPALTTYQELLPARCLLWRLRRHRLLEQDSHLRFKRLRPLQRHRPTSLRPLCSRTQQALQITRVQLLPDWEFRPPRVAPV